jgi:hypothetical protein
MHIEGQRSTPTVDEEQFRLLTGFNDIFVSIAAAILLFAVAWIGHKIGQNLGLSIDGDGPAPTGPLAVAATAWGLALFFTAKRMLPPSRCWHSSVEFATAAFGLVPAVVWTVDNNSLRHCRSSSDAAAGAPGCTGKLSSTDHGGGQRCGRSAGHGADRLAGPGPKQGHIARLRSCSHRHVPDVVDIRSRSYHPPVDVAFGHLLALMCAPGVHPAGLNDGNATIAEGFVILSSLGLTALAIDRRALLVSALAYVLYALNEMFRQFGAVELNVALGASYRSACCCCRLTGTKHARWWCGRPVFADLPMIDRSVATPQPAAQLPSGARIKRWPRLSS